MLNYGNAQNLNQAQAYNAASNQALGGLQSGVTKPPNPSCFGNLDDARISAEGAAHRVEQMVDRLCGTVPAEATQGADPRGHVALFDAADQNAHAIRACMARINVALDRLDKQLP